MPDLCGDFERTPRISWMHHHNNKNARSIDKGVFDTTLIILHGGHLDLYPGNFDETGCREVDLLLIGISCI
jgi:hypothetical protein